MANNSIKAAFERMWQHVVNALDGKAEVTHSHSISEIEGSLDAEQLPLIPIENGGTNATAAPEARINLGFEYGETAPTHTPSTGEGSVYFMIEEDAAPTAIEEGGTGAITGHDALTNLGAVDYVVDQKTEGMWTWRKWASGIAECWGATTVSKENYTTAGTGFYGYYGDINFPDDLFTSVKSMNYNVRVGNGFSMPASGNMGLSITSMRWFAVATLSGVQECNIMVNAKGFWK